MCKRVCRVVSISMFIVAVIFIGYCFLHPEAGSVFYIREFRVGSAEMNVVYGIYAVTTVMMVPSRFMRKIVCRLRLNEVSRQ